MSPEIILLLLRVLSAAVLLAFLFAIAWLSYQDINTGSSRSVELARTPGLMRVVRSESNSPIAGNQFQLHLITSIGRSESNTIMIDDDYASLEHALVTLRGEQWLLEDLGSRNGTLLNDVPISTAIVISSGDVITIGRTSLRVEL